MLLKAFLLSILAFFAQSKDSGFESVASSKNSEANCLKAKEKIVLMDEHTRSSVFGLKHGPDSPLTQWNYQDQTYFLFSGMSVSRERSSFRMRLVDGELRFEPDPAIDGKFKSILEPTRDRVQAPVQQLLHEFDLDYAGGGNVISLQCPQQEYQLYFYHSENHTDPAGKFHQKTRSGKGGSGWSGIGLAKWDEAAKQMQRIGQVYGVERSNEWVVDGDTYYNLQIPPAAGFGSVVVHQDHMYLFTNDFVADDSPYAEPKLNCAKQICGAISRVSLEDACHSLAQEGIPHFKKCYVTPGEVLSEDCFSEPALLEGGVGGKFTPFFKRSNDLGPLTPYVHYFEDIQKYMVFYSMGHKKITYRLSDDLLNWSEPYDFYVRDQETEGVFYPSIIELDGKTLLTYTQIYIIDNFPSWQNGASVIGIELDVESCRESK